MGIWRRTPTLKSYHHLDRRNGRQRKKISWRTAWQARNRKKPSAVIGGQSWRQMFRSRQYGSCYHDPDYKEWILGWDPALWDHRGGVFGFRSRGGGAPGPARGVCVRNSNSKPWPPHASATLFKSPEIVVLYFLHCEIQAEWFPRKTHVVVSVSVLSSRVRRCTKAFQRNGSTVWEHSERSVRRSIARACQRCHGRLPGCRGGSHPRSTATHRR